MEFHIAEDLRSLCAYAVSLLLSLVKEGLVIMPMIFSYPGFL